MPADECTALYRYFDTDGGLLYIGISNDPDSRWKAHQYGSDRETWPRLVVRRTVAWHDSRPATLTAEEAAIRSERPRFNGKHNYVGTVFEPSRWSRVTAAGLKWPLIADLIRMEIASGRWLPGERLPTLKAMATATGVSMRTVSKAAVALQGEGLLTFRSGHGLFAALPEAVPKPTVLAPPKPKTLPKVPHDWFWQFGFVAASAAMAHFRPSCRAVLCIPEGPLCSAWHMPFRELAARDLQRPCNLQA
ncbi:GntR family transcriptional regulator [Streptomyces melanosporofaciens]